MIILVSGMPRSASTWSYNVCRLLAENVGLSVDAESGMRDAEAIDRLVAEPAPRPGTVRILKWHFPQPPTLRAIARGEIHNVYTVRDPRSAVASLMRTFGTSFKNAAREIQRSLNLLAFYQRTATIIVPYRLQQREPVRAVQSIAAGLGLDVSPDGAAAIAGELGRERMRKQIERNKEAQRWRTFERHRHDPEYLLTEDHIRCAQPADWRRDLTPSQARYLSSVWREQLALCGVGEPPQDQPSAASLADRARWGMRLKLWRVAAVDLAAAGGER